jgi:hypothetical protein
MNNIFLFILIIICVIIFLSRYIYNKNHIDTKNDNTTDTTIEYNNGINLKYDKNNNFQNILDKTDKLNVLVNPNDQYINKILSKINPEVLDKIGISVKNIENFLSSSTPEPFEIVETFLSTVQTKKNIPLTISFKPIKPNKLYYGLPCDYIKNDCFYDALKLQNFVMTDNIFKACLIVPCSYETTEKELDLFDKNKIELNEYGDGVRIFMLNNTDHMVSKLALWKYLKQKYGSEIASTMLVYSWDLTDNNDLELFKRQYDKNKLYITKNNNQRQEGIEIHSSLDSILNSKKKYLLVQELLQDPYLVSGRKINLRVYVLVIRDNYSNIKLNVYRDGFMYYTPELFEPGNPSFKKNITTGYIDRQIYIDNPLTHNEFRKWLDNHERTLTPIEKYIRQTHPNIKISDYIFSQIYEQLGFIFKTYENIIGTKTKGVSFQLYGVDVAINNNLNPLVMEINKGPDLSAKDTRDRNLKINLCFDILKSVGLIDDINNNFITILEKVNIDGEHILINNLVEH